MQRPGSPTAAAATGGAATGGAVTAEAVTAEAVTAEGVTAEAVTAIGTNERERQTMARQSALRHAVPGSPFALPRKPNGSAPLRRPTNAKRLRRQPSKVPAAKLIAVQRR